VSRSEWNEGSIFSGLFFSLLSLIKTIIQPHSAQLLLFQCLLCHTSPHFLATTEIPSEVPLEKGIDMALCGIRMRGMAGGAVWDSGLLRLRLLMHRSRRRHSRIFLLLSLSSSFAFLLALHDLGLGFLFEMGIGCP
jgi:hypothetical protein